MNRDERRGERRVIKWPGHPLVVREIMPSVYHWLCSLYTHLALLPFTAGLLTYLQVTQYFIHLHPSPGRIG